MEINGVDLQEMRALVAVIDAIDTEFYLTMLPHMPQSDYATHWSDTRVVHLDENEVHLSYRLGWSIDAGIGEEETSEIKLYEAKIPLKQLLDDAIPPDEKGQLVKWVQTEIEQVSTRNEIRREEGDKIKSISTKTKTWTRSLS